MYKVLITLILALSGCTGFSVNGTMCDNIETGPGVTIPNECRNYSEEEAEKASNKLVDEKRVLDKDIKFDSEDDK